MHKPHLLILLIFTLSCIICPAQLTQVDSLRAKIASANSDAEKLSALQALCRHNASMPADTLRLYAGWALQLALQQQDETKIWESKYIYAFSLQQRSMTDSSLLICDQLIKDIRHPETNFAIYHEVLGARATALKSKGRIKESAATVYQMLASAEKFHDRDAQINAYNLLTVTAGQLNGFDDPNANDVYLRKCIGWYSQAISLFKDKSYYRKYDRILVNLGITYYQLPRSNIDSALYYIDLALLYAKEQGQLRIIASCLGSKGSIFHGTGRSDSAEYYYMQEAAVEQKIGDPVRIAMSYSALRSVYHQRKDYKKALSYDKIEMDYCIKNHVPVDPVQYVEFAEDYKGLRNYKAYGEILDTLITIKDSLYQANSASALAEIQTKYEVEKKENTIIQQRYSIARKRYLIYGIAGLSIMIIAISFIVLIYRKREQQHRIREMVMEHETSTREAVDNAKEEERQRIIADLHDDVGGGLSTIRMVSDLIARQHEQTKELNNHMLKISSITKEVTQRMNTIVWALNTENNTAQNLIEYIREYSTEFFENSAIRFSSNLPDGAAGLLLTGMQRKNIFLCVKEALNNIYKHSQAQNAWIDISISDNFLTIAIHDDGKGLANENPFGNGLKNIQRRMKEINGQATFSTGPGTIIFLKIAVAVKITPSPGLYTPTAR